MSPERITWSPRRVSRAAQRPARIWVGVSSQSTSFMAWPMLCLPPPSAAANRSSVSIRRTELPIQSAVGRCPAAVTAIRSSTYSSSVNVSGWPSIRVTRSSPRRPRASASNRPICSPKARCADCASAPPSASAFIVQARCGPSSAGKPSTEASASTGSGSAYSATRSARPRPQKPSMSRSARSSTVRRSANGSTASRAGSTIARCLRCSAPAVK
ncbi:Uncharacterised protein [Mycobacteroides abscessus subsp. abscessus]|nr:Uncharacterised protein [Mycobacteroides abscessus subsp. abscessus]